jgi:hypothetical protein
MKKVFVILSALVLSVCMALVGCEKKAEAPKPVSTPTVTVPPAPIAVPAPAKPAKK